MLLLLIRGWVFWQENNIPCWNQEQFFAARRWGSKDGILILARLLPSGLREGDEVEVNQASGTERPIKMTRAQYCRGDSTEAMLS